MTPSPTASASPTGPVGWQTYTNIAGAYLLQYPPDWYYIPNPNIPNDYPSSFSNENAGYWPRTSPRVGTANNVFLTVLRDSSSASCGGQPAGTTSSVDTTLGNELAKRYLVSLPPGFGKSDPTYRIVVEVTHKGRHCWSLIFDSRTRSARDTHAAVADQIVASFKFLA